MAAQENMEVDIANVLLNTISVDTAFFFSQVNFYSIICFSM